MNFKKATAIICAYNEEKTVGDVIQSVSKAPIIDEIIVVNDGSTDNTGKVIKLMKEEIELIDIHLEANKGKGHAMAIGVENSSYELIVFVDADLSNIIGDHLIRLASPLLNKEADMVLGQATETLINYNINPFKSLTGQRALLRNDIAPIIESMKTSRFGVETLLNLYYQSKGKTIKYVMLKNLKHPTKFDKTSSIKAATEFLSEGHEIASTFIKNYDLLLKSFKNIINKNLNI